MEVKGEEERRSRREDEEKEDYYSLLNSPCSACHKVVQAILKCLGLESSSIPPPSSSSSSSSSPTLVEEEEDPGTETVSSLISMEIFWSAHFCSLIIVTLNGISEPIRR